MNKNVGVTQSANDYPALAKQLDEGMTAPPTPTVPTEPGNNGGRLADGQTDIAKAPSEIGDGSYAAGHPQSGGDSAMTKQP